MAIPVIDTRTSEQSWLTGRPQEWQAYATNSPTSWSATGLPSGVSINTSTGLISGTPTTRGVALASIVATNGSGDSEALLVPFSVRGSAGISQDPADQLALIMDFDLTTNEISIPGIDPPAAIGVEELATETATTRIKREMMRVKSGEVFPILVGFKRDGVLQDINANRIELSARENEPEQSYEITQDSTAVTKVGSGEDTRFRTSLFIPEDLLESVFSNFEDDNGTQAGLLAEISAAISTTAFDWTTEQKTSSSFNINGGSSDRVDTFSFTGLPQATTGPTTYTAMCEIDFASVASSSQDLVIPVDFDVEWNGASFDVTNVPSSITVTGTEVDAGSHWIATLEVTDVSGTATGVDVELTTSISIDDSTSYVSELDFSYAGVSAGVISGDPASDTTGSAGSDLNFEVYSGASSFTVEVSCGDSGADIKSNFNAAAAAAGFTPSAPVQSVIMDSRRNRVLLVLPTSNPWDSVDEINEGGNSDPVIFTSLDSSSANHKVELSGDPQDDEVKRSSDTFILTVERSINRD